VGAYKKSEKNRKEVADMGDETGGFKEEALAEEVADLILAGSEPSVSAEDFMIQGIAEADAKIRDLAMELALIKAKLRDSEKGKKDAEFFLERWQGHAEWLRKDRDREKRNGKWATVLVVILGGLLTLSLLAMFLIANSYTRTKAQLQSELDESQASLNEVEARMEKLQADLDKKAAAQTAKAVTDVSDEILELATVRAGKGIQTSLSNQIVIDPKNFGFAGKENNDQAVQEFAEWKAARFSILAKYWDPRTGEQVWIRDPDQSAYVLVKGEGAKVQIKVFIKNEKGVFELKEIREFDDADVVVGSGIKAQLNSNERKVQDSSVSSQNSEIFKDLEKLILTADREKP